MIVIADFAIEGKEHIPFNIAIIKYIKDIYIDEPIVYLSEKNNVLNIKSNFGDKEYDGIIFHEKKFNCPVEVKKGRWFVREIIEILNVLSLGFMLNKKEVNVLIITSILPMPHLILKKYLNVNCKKCLIFCHGELEYLLAKDDWRSMLLGYALKKALNIKNTFTNYIVLGEPIRKNANSILKKDMFRYSIDHPYIFDCTKQSYISNKKIPLQIGTIGIASVQKHTEKIFEIAKKCDTEAKFYIIGKIDKSLISFLKEIDNVDWKKNDDLIPLSEYEKKISMMDFLIFFNDNSHYKMCASGTFFDSLKYNKPIIAIKNDFLEYYFSIFGDIGYLCTNIQEMENIIKNIYKNRNVERYIKQIDNIKRAKEYLSRDHTIKQLEEIVLND